jgi:hypothetical protein
MLAYLAPSPPKYPKPALIAAFAIPEEVEPGRLIAPRHVEAVHLTKLRPDGSGKADVEYPKIVLGPAGGRRIVLAPPSDLQGLAITEGIEDALTVHQATGLGAWAAYSAGNMSKLGGMVPGYIEAVTIFAHRDKAGEAGARQLAASLYARGIEVLIEGIAPGKSIPT